MNNIAHLNPNSKGIINIKYYVHILIREHKDVFLLCTCSLLDFTEGCKKLLTIPSKKLLTVRRKKFLTITGKKLLVIYK